MQNINKKTIGITLIVMSLIIAINYLYFLILPNIISARIGNRAISEQFLTLNEYNSCQKNCLESYVQRITTGIEEQSLAAGLDFDISQKSLELSRIASGINYPRINWTVNNLLNDFDSNFSVYESDNDFNKKDLLDRIEIPDSALNLGPKDYRITNFIVIENNIIAELVPTGELTDRATLIISNLSKDKYALLAGPGTYFNENLTKKGIPKKTIEIANKRPISITGANKLLDKLPYTNKNSQYTIDYNYGDSYLDMYLVIRVYGQNESQLVSAKKSANDWLIKNGIKLSEIKIDYVETKTTEKKSIQYLE